MQQGPYLRRSVHLAAQGGADNDLLHTRHYDPQINEAVFVAFWGNKWGNVPHGFQVISNDLIPRKPLWDGLNVV